MLKLVQNKEGLQTAWPFPKAPIFVLNLMYEVGWVIVNLMKKFTGWLFGLWYPSLATRGLNSMKKHNFVKC
jgi:hypothetical protein